MMGPGWVLLVEDDENDVFFFDHAFQATGTASALRVARTGREAIEVLSAADPLPRLVVLDINLPGPNGLEVLAWIRARPEMETLPVVMFTASAAERDVRGAARAGANSYVLKPGNLDALGREVRALVDYWLATHHGPYTRVR
jgi:CheY-like chemotaxis protein